MHASQVAAVLAFALGVSAIPREHHRHHSGRPSASFPWASGTGVALPTGTGLAPSAGFPAPSGFSFVSTANKKSSDDDDDDEDSDSKKSSSTKKSKSTKTKSSSSSSATVESSGSSNSTSSGATTTAPASLSGGSSSSGGSIPASSGSSALSAVQTIAAGESFDGGMFVFDRGTSCTGQAEGGDSDAVFQIENGGSLSNVIIGPNQIEGVHCQGACTLKNVWWSAVCEDAFTIKNQAAGETTNIIGGGAFGAEDKVLQHNGGGSLSVSGFTVDNFGKLYRSCGNCKTQSERHVIFDDITASEGSILAGINSNLGDTATFTNINVSGVETICEEFEGTDDNDVEPAKVGSGPSAACIYTTSDITGA